MWTAQHETAKGAVEDMSEANLQDLSDDVQRIVDDIFTHTSTEDQTVDFWKWADFRLNNPDVSFNVDCLSPLSLSPDQKSKKFDLEMALQHARSQLPEKVRYCF